MHSLFYFTHYISIKYGNQNNSTVWSSLRTADGSIRNSKVACPKAFSRINNSSTKLLKKFEVRPISFLYIHSNRLNLFSQLQFHLDTVNLLLTFPIHFLLPWFWLSIRSLHWLIIYDPKLDCVRMFLHHCQFLITLSINIDTDWWSGNHFETSILPLWISRPEHWFCIFADMALIQTLRLMQDSAFLWLLPISLFYLYNVLLVLPLPNIFYFSYGLQI